MDIRFYDESYYLTQGIFTPVSQWLADYSALYSLYYKGLSFFEQDALNLYYLNYRVWAFVFSGLIFLILYRNGVHPGFSLIWAICGLSAQINYLLWPKAGHFAMLGVAIGLFGLQQLRRNKSESLIWVSGCAAVLSWARPEFSLGSILGFGFFLFWLAKSRFSEKINRFWVFIPWVLSGGFTLLWGLPIGNSGRGGVAFGQHFVHNWSQNHGADSKELMFAWVNWRPIFESVFGPPESMISSILSNPSPLFWHSFHNTKQLINNVFSYFLETLVPVHWLGWSIFLTVGLLWFLAEFFNNFNGLSRFLKHYSHPISRNFWLVFPLAIPSLTAGLLFLPRPHYLIPLFPFFVWGAALWIQGYNFPKIKPTLKSVGLFLVVLMALFFLPDSSAFFRLEADGKQAKVESGDARYFSVKTPLGLKNQVRMKAALAIDWPAGTRLFDGSTGVTEFLGNRVIQTGKTGFEMNYPILKDFDSFVKNEKVTAIYLAPSLQEDKFFSHTPFLHYLKNQPEKMGWREVQLNYTGDRLFFKN